LPPAVEVVPYDAEWPRLYEEEADRIRAACGSALRVIEHVGSTSVPGLDAKPIVDVAASVESFDALDFDVLESLGYRYVPDYEDELPNRRYFKRAGFHLHVYEREHDEFLDYLRFREYLRTHPEDRDAYAALKRRLAETCETRGDYQRAKDAYVARLVAVLRRG